MPGVWRHRHKFNMGHTNFAKFTSRLESLDSWSVTKASSTLRNYKIKRHHTKISGPVDLAPGIFSLEFISTILQIRKFLVRCQRCNSIHLHEPGYNLCPLALYDHLHCEECHKTYYRKWSISYYQTYNFTLKGNGKVFPLQARLWPRGWVEV